MGKKIVVELNNDLYSDNTTEEYDEANKKLYDVVTFYKNKITEFYENKSWDRYKKLSNEYELIFTSPNAPYNVSKYSPVSRSFFKLWEILHDFKTEIFKDDTDNMRCLFLAEGPGGFVEAMMKFRHDYFPSAQDTFYGITLKSNNNKTIPDWKYKNTSLSIIYGKDGTGNLYNPDNIQHLCDTLGEGSMDFITADGGFDFSSDFNCQEEMSLRLLTCEIYAGMRMQREGGTLIVKVFDIFNPFSINLLKTVCNCYDTSKLVKPLTSRPANSEKYLVCTGYKRIPKYLEAFDRLVRGNWNEHGAPTQPVIDILGSLDHDIDIKKNLVMFNMFYISRQVLYIQRTIDYIKQFTNTQESGSIKKIIDSHVEKVKRWCLKYHIPIA